MNELPACPTQLDPELVAVAVVMVAAAVVVMVVAAAAVVAVTVAAAAAVALVAVGSGSQTYMWYLLPSSLAYTITLPPFTSARSQPSYPAI